MKESPYDISDAERHECFGVKHEGYTCEDCGDAVEEPGACQSCFDLRRELEMDDAWCVWLAGLKHKADQDRMEAISNSLDGWKYIGGDIQHERTSQGIALASANNLRFLAPGHRGHLVFTDQHGLPVVTIHGGKDIKFPDWTATFTSCTPLETILAACHAVIHQ